MKTHKRRKAVHADRDGNGRHLAHIAMTSALWDKLNQIADREGREQGRPKSVSAVMRKMLQAGVDARSTK